MHSAGIQLGITYLASIPIVLFDQSAVILGRCESWNKQSDPANYSKHLWCGAAAFSTEATTLPYLQQRTELDDEISLFRDDANVVGNFMDNLVQTDTKAM